MLFKWKLWSVRKAVKLVSQNKFDQILNPGILKWIPFSKNNGKHKLLGNKLKDLINQETKKVIFQDEKVFPIDENENAQIKKQEQERQDRESEI